MRILAALAMLPMLPVMAAETTASMSSAGMGAQLSKLLLGLLLVIGLIFLLAWLLRRVQQLRVASSSSIRGARRSSRSFPPRRWGRASGWCWCR